MSKGLNKVILIGNMGDDPDIRYMPNGSAVCNIRLATEEQWKDKQSGQKQSHTEWHRVVFFSRLAEICGEYLKKGSKIYVEGYIRYKKWTDAAGVERVATEIHGREMLMLDTRRDTPTQTYSRGFDQPTGGMGKASIPDESYDDDIPF